MGDQDESYVEFPGTGIRISVPDDPEGERAAVASHPDFQRLLAQARRDFAAGRGIPAEELYAELGYTPPNPQRRETRGHAGAYSGRLQVRVPKSVHRELAERAQQAGISISQLVRSYVGRGLGEDARHDQMKAEVEQTRAAQSARSVSRQGTAANVNQE